MTQKITGYRTLTDVDVELINEVKANGQALLDNYERVLNRGNSDVRWLSIARTDLQTSVMAAVRSIAKPEGI